MDALSSNTDLELFSKLSKGNEKAFESLFVRYRQKIYAVALQVLKDPGFAEELLQELFVRLWNKREQLEGVVNPSAYLYKSTRNMAVDMLRRLAAESRAREAIAMRMEEEQALAGWEHTRELESLIQRAIASLPPKRKEIFLLSRNTNLTVEQIARHAGVSKNTVKSHLLLASQSIRTYLRQYRYISLISLFSTFF